MEIFVQNLSTVDALRWRLVNKIGNFAACSVLNLRGVQVTFSQNCNTLTKFLDTIENRLERKLPFSSFQFCDLENVTDRDLARFQSQCLWIFHYSFLPIILDETTVGERIKLTVVNLMSKCAHSLQSFEGSEAIFSQNDFLNLPKLFPCLHTLKAWSLNGDENSLLSIISSRAPNLKLIVLNLKYFSNYTTLRSALSWLPQFFVRACSKSVPISLDLTVQLYRQVVESLEELTGNGYRKLKALRLEYEDSIAPTFVDTLNRVLEAQAEALETLEIVFLAGTGLPAPQHPVQLTAKMTKLQKLKFFFHHNFANPTPLKQFQPDQFPQLRILHLGVYNHAQKWFNYNLKVPTLRELRVSYHGEAKEEEFHTIFPNLTKLQIPVCSFSFKKYVITHMVTLHELEMGMHYDQQEEDAMWNVYTGGLQRMSEETFQAMQGQHDYILRSSAGPPEQNLSSLANLNRLITLVFYVRDSIEVSAFVWLSRLGLIPKLESLKIGFPDEHTDMEAQIFWSRDLRGPRIPNIVHYVSRSPLLKPSYESYLKNYHQNVEYVYFIA